MVQPTLPPRSNRGRGPRAGRNVAWCPPPEAPITPPRLDEPVLDLSGHVLTTNRPLPIAAAGDASLSVSSPRPATSPESAAGNASETDSAPSSTRANLPEPRVEQPDKSLRALVERLESEIRRRNYSRRTEKAYVFWVRRYVHFHGRRHPAHLEAPDVKRFLSDLAVTHRVSASTQNQAFRRPSVPLSRPSRPRDAGAGRYRARQAAGPHPPRALPPGSHGHPALPPRRALVDGVFDVRFRLAAARVLQPQGQGPRPWPRRAARA